VYLSQGSLPILSEESQACIASAAKRVSPLVRQTGLSREAIVAALFEHFKQRFGGSVDALREDEMQMAEQLVASKYGNDEWTREIA
jgi:lipoate-protein ligase A